MGTPYDTNLPADLRALKQEIEGWAREYGLDFYETIFEVLDAEDLNEVAAYGGFPTRYPHWSFGMSFEQLKKGYDYGLSKIYEMVINNDPCYAYLMRCNHTLDQKLVMAHVYGHCLAPETQIITSTGVKPICDIYAGERVLTHTGCCRPVKMVAKRWHRGPICHLTVSGSNEPVRITAEHPVYVLRPAPCVLMGRQRVPCRPTCQLQHKCSAPRPFTKYKLTWIPAGEVQVGDYVALPRPQLTARRAPALIRIPIDKIHHRQHITGAHKLRLDKSLAKFLGYFISEGSALERGLVSFGFHNDEIEFHAEVGELAKQLFGVNIGADHDPEHHSTTVRFNALEVAAWLREQVGTSAANKRIPAFLLEGGTDEQLQACVQGIFNGDGYYTAGTHRQSGSLSLATISEQLAHQVRHLCARWGIHTHIYARKRSANRQRSYDLIWSGTSAHKLSEILFGRDVIPGNRSFERAWADEHYVYRAVRAVEKSQYDGLVYNFSVARDESYTLAAGMVVHNCDFFKNNAYFAHTSRKMMDEMANHGTRLRRYAEKYGEDEVEAFIDKCMSIDDLIDVHSTAIRRRDEVSRYDFAPKSEEEEEVKLTRFKSKDYMDDYINPRKALKQEEEERKKLKDQTSRSFPEHPEKDVLLFLIENAPLKPWQRDVLSIIRDEAYYFAPQGQTKVINEGWASFWHSTIMTQKSLQPSELIDYADHHSGTMATYGARLNPYKLGIELLRDIEHRWNTGKFGKEYDECDDLEKRRKWDKQLGLGRQKIFEVRRVHNDITFIDTFLTPEFCVQHKMFSYAFQEQMGQYVIESREFEKIKLRLLHSLTNFGKPWIYVVDGNYHNRGELLLKHEHHGADLRLDQAADTLANIQFIWSRPVHLQTVVDGKPTLLSFDGSEHSTRTLGESDEPKRNSSAKTR
jgi:stage V sporulation protein R